MSEPGVKGRMSYAGSNLQAPKEIRNIASRWGEAEVSSGPIGDRLMVGQQPLELLIKVRILVPEPAR
jgi:hypothetical protein